MEPRAIAARIFPWPYLGSLSLAIGALLVALPVNVFVDAASPTRVFLVAILISAISFGLWPSIVYERRQTVRRRRIARLCAGLEG